VDSFFRLRGYLSYASIKSTDEARFHSIYPHRYNFINVKVGFGRFEDIEVWQKSKNLTTDLYTILEDSKDFGFRDQIQRASVSIMNNISEGFERRTNKEFRQFLYYARGSCSEVKSMLYLALDLAKIEKQQQKLMDLYSRGLVEIEDIEPKLASIKEQKKAIKENIENHIKRLYDPVYSTTTFSYFIGPNLIINKYGEFPSVDNFYKLLTKPILPSDLI